MDGGQGGAGSGGPSPFLIKTYEMVDDSSTDEIVSWSSSKKSFVVWNPPEFARLLLPTYFKHNNFSSFIRQLNTYGFRKIDPEKWEFANEEFIKDQKHLLKNIHRRKPIHSHSNPQGSVVDPERTAFEEEIERLSREKATLEANVLKFNQQRSVAKHQVEDLTQRVNGLAKRQEDLLTFLEKAVQNPCFIDRLARKVESMDFSAYNKKRRLPQADDSQPIAVTSFVDNHSSSKTEFGTIFHQDFSNKLRLELSPTVSDGNLLSPSTQSLNEDGESPQTRIQTLHFSSDTFEQSDAGTSFTLKMDSSLSRKVSNIERPRLQSLQPSAISSKEGDSHISCHLNLTLASSPLQVNESAYSARTLQQGQEVGKSAESTVNYNRKEDEIRVFPMKSIPENKEKTLSSEPSNEIQGPSAAPVRVNDVFWEQFLTERPGCSDNEEASSNYRENPYDEADDGRSSLGMSRNRNNIGHLSL